MQFGIDGLTYDAVDKRWILRGPPFIVTQAHRLGFYYDAALGAMYTCNALLATPFMHLLHDPEHAAIWERDSKEAGRRLHNSRATTAPGYEPKKPFPLEYKPFQKAGIAFALENPRCIIADDMGLGKTVQMVGIINNNTNIQNALIVTTNSVKLSVLEHFQLWLIRPLSFAVVSPNYYPTAANIVIINYDLLHKYAKALKLRLWDFIGADECQNLKNPSARRSQVFYELEAPIVVGFTGTPVMNRINEIFPFIHYLKPKEFPSKRDFQLKYTDNEEMMQLALRSSVMIRRLKSEVLTDLPPKQRQIIELPSKGIESILAEELEVYTKKQILLKHLRESVLKAKEASSIQEYKSAVATLRKEQGLVLRELARVRLQTGIAKIPYLIKFIEELSENENKLTVFCHHLEVQGKLQDYFGSAATLHNGSLNPERKKANLQRFESDISCRYLILGIKTAVGFNEAAKVCQVGIMGELDWTPANLWQAEDRLHRIGQMGSVLIYYPMLEGSLETRIARMLVKKQDIIEKSINAKVLIS